MNIGHSRLPHKCCLCMAISVDNFPFMIPAVKETRQERSTSRPSNCCCPEHLLQAQVCFWHFDDGGSCNQPDRIKGLIQTCRQQPYPGCAQLATPYSLASALRWSPAPSEAALQTAPGCPPAATAPTSAFPAHHKDIMCTLECGSPSWVPLVLKTGGTCSSSQVLTML